MSTNWTINSMFYRIEIEAVHRYVISSPFRITETKNCNLFCYQQQLENFHAWKIIFPIEHALMSLRMLMNRKGSRLVLLWSCASIMEKARKVITSCHLVLKNDDLFIQIPINLVKNFQVPNYELLPDKNQYNFSNYFYEILDPNCNIRKIVYSFNSQKGGIYLKITLLPLVGSS